MHCKCTECSRERHVGIHTVAKTERRQSILSPLSPFKRPFFSGEPGLASFIEAKDDGGGGDNLSYETYTFDL